MRNEDLQFLISSTFFFGYHYENMIIFRTKIVLPLSANDNDIRMHVLQDVSVFYRGLVIAVFDKLVDYYVPIPLYLCSSYP